MTTRLPVPSEHEEQVALFSWAEIASWGAPGVGLALRLMHAIPNGGHRHKATAARLKAEGVRAGMPDVHLPVRSADGLAIGLWIELKRQRGGRLSPVQADMHEALRLAGHRVEVCAGWQAAADAIVDYLRLPRDVAPWRQEVSR